MTDEANRHAPVFTRLGNRNEPYHIIAGDGLGLKYSSLETIGDILPVHQEGFGQAGLKIYPNIANGNLVLQDRMLKIQESPGVLNLGYTYNSQAKDIADLWHFSMKKLVQMPNSQGAVLQEEDGHYTPYVYDQVNNIYKAPLTQSGTPWMRFDSTQNLWVMNYPGSNAVEYYNINGFLVKRTDNIGHYFTYEYDSFNNITAIVVDNDRRYGFYRDAIKKSLHVYLEKPASEENEVLQIFVFDDLGRISESLSGDGLYRTQYTYGMSTNSWKIQTATQSDNTKLVFDFDYDSHQFNFLKMGDQSSVSINYNNHKITLEDFLKIKTEISLDENQHIASVTRLQGYMPSDKSTDKTSYLYHKQGQVKQVITPDGGITQLEYDAFTGLMTKKIDPNQQTQEKFYQKNGDKVFLIGESVLEKNTYPNRPAQLVTRYVYDERYNTNKSFLRFKIDPNGCVTEFRPDRFGNIGSARKYTANLFDVSTMEPNVSPALDTMLEWVKQQDSQKITLTEYQYTPRGQILITTSYTHVDKDGNGIKDGEMSQVATYVNMFGNCFSLQVKHGENNIATTSQNFDGMQRLLSRTDALKQITKYQYIDAENKTIITYPDGKTEVQQRNNKGDLIQKTEIVKVDDTNPQTRTTKFQRDGNGRLILTTRPDQQWLYGFYDRQNRLGFKVSTEGVVTEYRYDRQNRFNTKIEYDQKIDVKKLWLIYPPPPGFIPGVNELLKLIPSITNPAKDKTSYTFLDNSGRKKYSVDADEFITQYFYNDRNQTIAKLLYADKVSASELSDLKKGQALTRVPNFDRDQCQRIFYRENKQKLAEQDAKGYITEFVYDTALRCTDKIKYFQKAKIDPTQNDFEQTRPLPSEKDEQTKYHYASGVNPISEVDASHFTTTFQYTPFGEISQSTREDQTTVYQYDLLQRPVSIQKPYHRQEQFQYDINNNKIFQQVGDATRPTQSDGDSLRRTEKQFNAWNQLSHEANVFVGQLLAQIDLNPDIPPPEKEKQKTAIWQNNSTRHEFDYLTELKIKSTDSRNIAKVYYYNKDYQLIARINLSNGAIKEYTRDSSNRVIAIREYNQFIPESQRVSLTGGILTDSLRDQLNHLQDDSRDHKTILVRNKRGKITQKIDPENYLSLFSYRADGNIDEEKHCVEQSTPSLTIRHEYDTRGLETKTVKQTATQTLTVSRAYENPNGKQTAYTDELGRTTQTQYDKSGQVAEIISPDNVVIQQKTWNAFGQVLTEINALNQKTSYTYNQNTREVVIQHPLKNTQKKAVNVFQEVVSITDGLNNTQSIQHAPDGQISKNTDALGNSETKIFDLNGNTVSKTDANGIQSDYHYNSDNKIIAEIKDAHNLKLTTQTNRDIFNDPVEIIDPRKIHTKQLFDKNSRLLKSIQDPDAEKTKGLNLTTEKNYNAQNTVTQLSKGSLQNPNQYQEVVMTDSLGRKTGKTIDPDGLKIQTNQHLSLSGKVIAEIDANQNINRKFYDNLDRLRITVDAEGGVKEKIYNTENQIITEKQYEQKIDANKLNDSSTLQDVIGMIKPDPQDGFVAYFYDDNGNKRFEVNSLGVVGERRYDLADREIRTLKYATSIDPKIIPTLTTAQLIDLMKSKVSTQDRVRIKILDQKNQVRFQMLLTDDNKKAIITEKRYDNVGNVITEVGYAVKVTDPEKIAQLPPEKVLENLSLDAVNDRAIYRVFDSSNNPQYTVDAEEAVTQFWHDENNNLTQACVYSARIKNPGNYDSLVKLLKTLSPDHKIDCVTQSQFDNANRKKTEIDAMGNVDHFQLDDLGNIIIHIDRANNNWLYHYDGANRLDLETKPSASITAVQENSVNGSVKLTASQTTLAIQDKKIYDNLGNVLQVIKAFNIQESRTLVCDYSKRNQLIQTKINNTDIDDVSKPASFSARPVRPYDVVSKIFYNPKKLKICEQNAAGQCKFYIYNSEGKPVYEVNNLGYAKQYARNSFGEIIAETAYANKINLDLSQYTQTGIPLNVIQQAGVITASSEDRTKTYERNTQGNVVLTQSGKTFYYIPTGTKNPKYAFDYSKTLQQYNAFGECTCQLTLTDPEMFFYAQQLYWFDRKGKTVAECNPTFAVIRRAYDSFGHEVQHVEWALAPKQEPGPNTKLAELDSNYVPSPKDRLTYNQYNLVGDCTKKTIKQVIIQEIIYDKDNIPTMQDKPSQDLTQEYQYNPLQQRIAVKYENNSIAYNYYDSRGLQIASTDVVRENMNHQQIVPLTYFGNDAFGQRVLTTKFKQGTGMPVPDKLPAPIGIDSDDQTDVKLFDNRGLVKYTQNPEGTVTGFTYTLTRKVSRQYYYLTNNDAKHLDEKKFEFDGLDRGVLLTILRDNKVIQKTASKYDAFNCIAEGPGDDTWPLYRRYDVLNNVWSTNSTGVNVITLRNLMAQETVSFKSTNHDLSLLSYSQLAEMVSWKSTDLERTETHRDNVGRKLATANPVYSQRDPNDPANVPLNIISGNGYPDFGKTSLTWIQPQETNYVIKMTIWPKAAPDKQQPIYIKTINNRCGVDVSVLGTDVYSYEMDYYFTNPITGKIDEAPRYRTQGDVQIDTGNSTNSLMMVVEVEDDNYTINLTGNTTNVTAIQLWEGSIKIAELPVVRQNGKCTVDLSQFYSGVYTVVPIIPGKDNIPGSLSFTIYTPKPSKSPLSKQYETSFYFVYNNVIYSPFYLCLAELVWSVPKNYEQFPVLFTCTFVDWYFQVVTLQDTIIPGKYYGGVVWDPNGTPLHINTLMFTRPHGSVEGYSIREIQSVSLALQLNATDQLVIANNVQPSASNGDGWSEFGVVQFPTASTLYISPLTGFSKLPTLSYLDVTMDRLATWKMLPARGMDSQGVFVDVTNLEPSIYPFKIADKLSFWKSEYQISAVLKAKLPGHNDVTRFKEALPKKQKGLSYHLLKINREKIVELLESQKNNQPIRQQLASEILQALMLKTFITDDVQWEMLKDKYDKELKAYNKLFAMLERRKISHNINYNQEQLNQEKLKYQAVEKQMLAYCSDLKTVENYIHHLKSDGEMGMQTALIYANFNNMTLYFWEKDPDHQDSLRLINFHNAGENSQQTFHFNAAGNIITHVLLPDAVEIEDIYDPQPEWSFTVDPADGSPYPSNQAPPSHPVELEPSCYYKYDAWNNLVERIDTLGHVTRYDYRHDNQVTILTQPEVYIIDESKSITYASPVISSGYNKRGYKIGITDANKNTKAFMLDDSGQEVSQVLQDGLVVRQQNFNALGRRESHTDARGFVWQYQYNHLNSVLMITYPSKLTTKYLYNELNHRIKDTDQSGYTVTYDYDALENISTRYSPTNLPTSMTFDRNHQMLSIINPDDSSMTWERNYFGLELHHKDLAGVTYTNTYDFKFQVTRRYSDSVRMNYLGEVIYYLFPDQDQEMLNVHIWGTPNTDLLFQYDAGRLALVTDNSSLNGALYEYDSENHETAIFTEGRVVHSSVNGLGEIEYTYNSGATVSIICDANRNERHVVINCGQSKDIWYSYDKANRVIFDGSVGTGLTLSYQSGFRVQETNSQGIYRTLVYNIDGVVTDINYNQIAPGTIISTHRDFLPNGTLTHYSEGQDSNNFYNHTITTDTEGWQHDDMQTGKDGALISHTVYDNFSKMGLPSTQNSDYADNFADRMTNTYGTSYEDHKLTSVSGQRHDQYGWGNASTATKYYDANGFASVMTGLDDSIDPGQAITSKIFWTMYDGKILWRDTATGSRSKDFPGMIEGSVSTSSYYYNTRGELIASYGTDSSNQEVDDVTVTYMQRWGNRFGSQFKSIENQNVKNFESSAHAPHLTVPDFIQTYPAQAPREYIAASGDTCTSIAQRLVGDANFGSAIAGANGLVVDETLFVGQKLSIPQFLPSTNNINNATPYEQFMSIMIGNLYPHLDLKQPKKKKHGGWLGGIIGDVIHALVDVAAAIIGEVTGGPLGAAVFEALADAAYQEVATGEINFKGAILAGVEGGISMGVMGSTLGTMTMGGLFKAIASMPLQLAIEKAGEIAVADQLVEMLAGVRKQFDFGAVLTQITSTVVMYSLAPAEDKFFNISSKEFSASIINSETEGLVSGELNAVIEHQKFDISSVAAQSLGSAIGSEIGADFKTAWEARNTQVSNAYQEAQQSSSNNNQNPGRNRNGFFSGSSSNRNITTSNDNLSDESNTIWTTDNNGNPIQVEKRNPFPRLDGSTVSSSSIDSAISLAGSRGLQNPSLLQSIEKEFSEEFHDVMTYVDPGLDKAGDYFKIVSQKFSGISKDAFNEGMYYLEKAQAINSGNLMGLKNMAEYDLYSSLTGGYLGMSTDYANLGVGAKVLSRLGLIGSGLDVKFAYDAVNNPNLSPQLKTKVEIEEYGGVAVAYGVGVIATPRIGIIGGAVAGIISSSFWKGMVEHFYEPDENVLSDQYKPKMQ